MFRTLVVGARREITPTVCSTLILSELGFTKNIVAFVTLVGIYVHSTVLLSISCCQPIELGYSAKNASIDVTSKSSDDSFRLRSSQL